MYKFHLGLIFSLVAVLSVAQSVETNKDLLNRIVIESSARAKADSTKAVERGIPFTIEMDNNRVKTFKGFDGEIPLYVAPTTLNEVNTYYGSDLWAAPYNVKGNLQTAGLWEAYVSTGAAFPDITDLNFLQNGVGSTRIALLETGGYSWHAQNVALRIISDGAGSASTVGPAKEGSLRSFNVSNDIAEMATEAGTGMLISNHSYGFGVGWAGNIVNSGTTYQNWVGVAQISLVEDYKFGRYGDDDKAYDGVAYAAPYYLMVKAAGNERNDAKDANVNWAYWSFTGSTFVKIYTSNPPYPEKDGGLDGFDCIPLGSTAKNSMIVGACTEIPSGYSLPSDVVARSFSGFGPTDDGRIKPDIIAPGNSGTSYAAPNVTGAGMLLQELYKNTFGGNMRAATLKGLFIHTAYEAGSNIGPDYKHGWGLMNPKGAADVILNTNGENSIVEAVLANSGSNKYYAFLDAANDLSVTLCWTDPSGTPTTLTYIPSDLNDNTAMLVNDLDVRLKHLSSSVTTQPYILDPLNPALAATKGDNVRDNVEQIELASAATGWYEITVSHKGGLVNDLGNPSAQAFSLIFSGFSGYSCIQDLGANLKFWDGSNWSPSSPTSGEDVLIQGNLTLAANATYGNVIIESGVTVTLNMGVILSIQKGLSSANTSYIIDGNVVMNGTVAQNICGFVDIKNLEINNAAGVGITDDIGITGVTGLMKLTNGIFTTNNKLWLRSSAISKQSYAQLSENGGSLNGGITFQNTVQGGTGSWRHIGSPVNTTIGDLLEDMNYYKITSTGGSIYKWNAANSSWVEPSGTTDAFNATTAYTSFFGKTTITFSPLPFTIELSGIPNTGLIDNTLYYHAGSVISNGDGWNMLTNPYPENLDWDAIKTGIISWGGGINTSYYVWDGENSQYLSYNGTGTASRYIAPMQAFFVRLGSAADESSTAFDFTNSMRASSAPSAFLKTTPPQIVLFSQQAKSKDLFYMRFLENAKLTFETDKDAFKLFSPEKGIAHLYEYSLADSTDISIKSLPLNLGEYRIPLYYKNNQSGMVSLGIDHFTVANNWSIGLEDLLNGNKVDLKQTDYIFQHDSNNEPGRFVLIINNPDGKTDGKIVSVKPKVWLDEYFLNINTGELEAKEIRVLNTSGQLLYQQKNITQNAQQIPRYQLNVSGGVLFVQIIGSKQTVTVKLLVVN